MSKTAWHDTDHLGLGLNQQFNKLVTLAKTTNDITENIAITNSLGQAAMQLTNLKTAHNTSKEIAEIKQLLSYIPKEVMLEALAKINEQK